MPTPPHPVRPGRAQPLGPSLCADPVDGTPGVNFAVFSRHATAVEVCLFSADGRHETARIRLPRCTDGTWHGWVPGLTAGQLYGLRAHGPWQPEAGHRFNPAKLLLDPWACALVGPTHGLATLSGHLAQAPHLPCPVDNAALMPKNQVVDRQAELAAGAAMARAPHTDACHTVLYEAHVKALTHLHPGVPAAQRGTCAGLASPAMLAHYKQLGITTLCLLPVHQHLDERHLQPLGLTNHWGYNTLNFFAPDPRLSAHTDPAAVRHEFRQMVDTLHRHGIEVVLDVVFNHTAEGDALGPTLSWRGLDQSSWYAMGPDGHHHNHSGCGNSLNFGEPRVVQLVMDSLRWWVQAFGVDGFRFDLAVSLGRDASHHQAFNPQAPLLVALRQDPVLGQVRLIAEPWDVGPHGHRTGQFGPGWAEWNDAFRDTVRAFWLGHHTTRGAFANRVCGSSHWFQTTGRSPCASIHMVTAHDGFTLADLVSHEHKHNEANGEHNRDGHNHNLSANGGVEGPTTDATVLQRRAHWQRALLATLFCAQGTPQLLAGDELGHSQQGNNNAYCQDNATTWLHWGEAGADNPLTAYVAGLTALRRRWPALRLGQWFTGVQPAPGTWPDVAWFNANGNPMAPDDWNNPAERTLVCVLTVGEPDHAPTERLLLAWHAAPHPATLVLPAGGWHPQLDSASGEVCVGVAAGAPPLHGPLTLPHPTVRVLVQPLLGGHTPLATAP